MKKKYVTFVFFIFLGIYCKQALASLPLECGRARFIVVEASTASPLEVTATATTQIDAGIACKRALIKQVEIFADWSFHCTECSIPGSCEKKVEPEFDRYEVPGYLEYDYIGCDENPDGTGWTCDCGYVHSRGFEGICTECTDQRCKKNNK